SNDSDLALPVRFARARVPVGVVNPTPSYFAGKLEGDPAHGVGGHWWYQLTAADLTAHQLPSRIGSRIVKPAPW
ncbi:MAG: NYN domain-containing protein, partial [Bifidobacteriaceae bacterium]|nr:NYN domain-containing protein [Bifidobacteriaceae bacterium]